MEMGIVPSVIELGSSRLCVNAFFSVKTIDAAIFA